MKIAVFFTENKLLAKKVTLILFLTQDAQDILNSFLVLNKNVPKTRKT